MWGMFVKVTGGMSLVDGGLWLEVTEAAVCGSIPVRTIGGWSRVEIAEFCQPVPIYADCALCYHSALLPSPHPSCFGTTYPTSLRRSVWSSRSSRDVAGSGRRSLTFGSSHAAGERGIEAEEETANRNSQQTSAGRVRTCSQRRPEMYGNGWARHRD
jgi:hypothetical protein